MTYNTLIRIHICRYEFITMDMNSYVRAFPENRMVTSINNLLRPLEGQFLQDPPRLI